MTGSKSLLGLVAGSVAWLAILSFLRPPTVIFDSAIGFAVARSMENGAPFNQRFLVDRNRISEDRTDFVSMWSPGQYVVPTIVETLGFNLGQAMVVTTTLFRVLSLWGFYLFFRAMGFSTRQSLLGIVAILFQARFLMDFRLYFGGDLLLNGYLPWAMLASYRLRELRPAAMAAITGLFLIGAFLKLSFLVAALAILASLFLARHAHRKDMGPFGLTLYSLKLLSIFGITYGLVWLSYLSRGPETAAAGSGVLAWSLRDFSFVLSGPAFSLFSLGDALVGTGEWGGAWLHGHVFPQLLLGSCISVASLYWIWKSTLTVRYKSFALGFSLAYVVVFEFLRIINSEVSFSYRHMIPPGLILLPALVTGIQNLRRERLRRLGGFALAAMLFANTSPFMLDYLFARRAVGAHGFAHVYLSSEALEVIHDLDRNTPPGNNLFLAPLPSIALEINSRVINEATAYTPLEQLQKNDYRGRVDNLFVILRTDAPEQRTKTILASFRDYDPAQWLAVPAAEWTVYCQGGFVRLPRTGRSLGPSTERKKPDRLVELPLLVGTLPYIHTLPSNGPH